MITQEIRRNFLKYFKEKGHTLVPSSSVVPHDDPTLLFTNAGMNQFKDAFLGKSARDYTRAASSQKCIRVGGKHNDLDNVGHTSRHLTFFEMLGNFSFGDYFKQEAITFAWEVATQVFGFEADRIWVSVFESDDEAYSLWEKILPTKQIVRLGEKENFWAMGDTGPCGPCSELLYDRGSEWGNYKNPAEDPTGERFLEFWNLVFMQYNREASGKMNPLPKKSIDTGSGLERVVALKMGVNTVFATDTFQSLIASIENVSGVRYEANNQRQAPAFHVIADHLRSLSFAIADGAQPSNMDRGYVLRKLLRRAVRYGKGLGMQEPFLAKLLPSLIDLMGADYKELISSKSRIEEILTQEEEAFFRTLKRGGNIFNGIIDEAMKSPLKQITGEEAFKLKDTYGFPIEEILLIAKDTGLNVNLESYELLEEQAKARSRTAHVVHHQRVEESLYQKLSQNLGSSEFVGYNENQATSHILAIVSNAQTTDSLQHKEEAYIFLSATPFYAEKGGQVGDTGLIEHNGAKFIVTDCIMPYPGLIAHVGYLESGSLKIKDKVIATIDRERRKAIASHHTATHLLHYALQKVIGSHIKQAGSLVEPNRLRFDFNYHKPLSADEIKETEKIINDKIRLNQAVNCYELPFSEVQSKEEIKQFFGDKYGSLVRVVDINYSKELCGGTHVSHVGALGFFRILKESSIAAGVRRIEAVCGVEAENLMYKEQEALRSIAFCVKASEDTVLEKVLLLIEENKKLTSELKNYKKASIKVVADQLTKNAKHEKGISLLLEKVEVDMEFIPLLFDELQKSLNPSIILLATAQTDKCNLTLRVSPELAKKGIHAGKIIQQIANLVEGSGGGKDTAAQAGGKNPGGIEQAMKEAKRFIDTLL